MDFCKFLERCEMKLMVLKIFVYFFIKRVKKCKQGLFYINLLLQILITVAILFRNSTFR